MGKSANCVTLFEFTDRDNPNYYSPDGCLVEKGTDKLVRGRTDRYGNAIIPDCVKSIGDEAFYGCLSLENAAIPCSVESIGECSFGNCVSLKSVTVPHSVKSIGKETFLGCDSLKIVTVPKSLANIIKDAFGPNVVVKGI